MKWTAFWALLALALAGLSCPAVAGSEKITITVRNTTSMQLHVYAAGLSEVMQVPPKKSKRIRLPVRFTYRGNSGLTYQLMVVGGGHWAADKSGWTTYRDAKTCTQHNFKNKKNDVLWTITGTAKKCNGPRGYHQ